MTPGHALAVAYNEFIERHISTPEDWKTGRVVWPDKSVSPNRDTGFRMATKIPTVVVRQPDPVNRRESLLDYIHVADIIDEGPAYIRGERVNAVRLISVNVEQARARELSYIHESIAARRKREQKENDDASKN